MISIVIPVYNVSQYIDKCMEGVINQTYKDIEIILINDGSTDNSGEICDRWGKRDNRIQVIHKKNGGLSSARNCGIDCAKGEYIMFIDSDDIISVNLCERLANLLIEQDANISICEVLHIFDNTDIKFDFEDIRHTYNSVEAICEMWYQRSFLPSAWGKLYKRSLFNNVRFTEGILFEDIDIMHELFYQCDKIAYTRMKMYGYVHRENSITTKKYSKRDSIILEISEKLLKFSSNKEKSLNDAAKAYSVAAGLRVYLNAPNTMEFKADIHIAKNILTRYGKEVLHNPKARKKTKYALVLYFYFRPFMNLIYKHVNRWQS